MRYEIDENNAVWGFVETQEEACLFQPTWPDGVAFADKDDATVFAEGWLAHLSDPKKNNFLTSRPE